MRPLLLERGDDLTKLAEIHAESFAEPWTAQALGDLLATPGAFAFQLEGGFVLVRAAAGEAEILTLAVRPALRRQGVGAALVRSAAEYAHRLGAAQIFLEVGVRNAAARGIYKALGFAEVGRRKGYYALRDGNFEDALILRSNLPLSALGNPPASG